MVRMELGPRLVNACLGETLRRLDLMRQSKDWQRVRGLNRESQKNERNEEFKRLKHKFGFTSASISAFGTKCKNEAGWQGRLGAHETQRIAERVFQSAGEYAFGRRGRPRFKGRNRPLHSLEGKAAGCGLRQKPELGCLEWYAMVLQAILPPEGKDPHLAEALTHRSKYARIVWRVINGKRRWLVQLVQEGLAPKKYQTHEGAIVGLDVGPSTVAVYSEQAMALVPLCPEVDQPWKKMRCLQRAMDRSRRATNPECYHANGTFKHGARVKVRSVGYRGLQRELAETERILEKRRARSHGRLGNTILGLGNVVQSEKLSYVAFQKSFGRSTKVRAAGALMAALQRKAESAGGEVVGVDTWRLKLSQHGHHRQTRTRKALSQRWHALGDGSGVVQRDMYSAFLAAQVLGGAIHPRQAEEAWPVAQSLLARARWMRKEPVSVQSLLKTAPALPAPERVVRETVLVLGHARDPVARKARAREPQRIRT